MTAQNKYLRAALYYAGRGWQVFPITPGKKEPPLCLWKADATTDQAIIKSWWQKTPDANVGIATGGRSGIVVLDVDPRHGGDESLLTLATEHGKLPDTVESMTGSGGRHIIFAHPGCEIGNTSNNPAQGLDIRGDGGYIVAPPSLHPNGKFYEWEPSCKPSQTELAPMPEWFIDLLKVRPSSNGNGKHAEPVGEKITEGGRNQTLTSLAGSMRRRGMSQDSILAALVTENDLKCSPPLDEDDIRKIAKSVSQYEPTTPPVVNNGNGKGVTGLAYRDPNDAPDGIMAFLDLLGHLKDRSVPTGIPSLDDAIGGLERQSLTVLAARPSMGKSTLAWQIARNVAASGKRAIFYSLEMSETSLWAKAICGAAGIRWRDIRNGDIPENVSELLSEVAAKLMQRYEDRLRVSDGSNTIETIWQGVDKYKPDVIIVDHLRLVANREDNEVQRLGHITAALKQIAKDTNCASLCLAQLNRQTENRDNKRPTLADLRDSGQIEENADLVLMMYREDYYDTQSSGKTSSETEILIRKYREDVGKGLVKLRYDLSAQWFKAIREI